MTKYKGKYVTEEAIDQLLAWSVLCLGLTGTDEEKAKESIWLETSFSCNLKKRLSVIERIKLAWSILLGK